MYVFRIDFFHTDQVNFPSETSLYLNIEDWRTDDMIVNEEGFIHFIIATDAVNEWGFSKQKLISTKLRTRMKPDLVQVLMVLSQKWCNPGNVKS